MPRAPSEDALPGNIRLNRWVVVAEVSFERSLERGYVAAVGVTAVGFERPEEGADATSEI